MDGLIRQKRARFSGVGDRGKEESSNNIRDGSLQPKSPPFDGEKKRSQNWLRRRFLRESSQDFDSNNGVDYAASAAFDTENEADYAAAVAAAAYAINLLEGLSVAEQKGKIERADASFRRRPSDLETPDKEAMDEKTPEKIVRPSPSIKKTASFAEMLSDTTGEKRPEKVVRPSPSIKKTASFTDKPLDTTGEKRPEKTVRPSTSMKKTVSFTDKTFDTTASQKTESELFELPPLVIQPTTIKRQSSAFPGFEETDADAWEYSEMVKIEEKYEKLSATIYDWESKKIAKAERQRDKAKQAELEHKRAKLMEKYRSEMENIAKIAAGARAQAEENRRKEEFKVKEKADKIRSTGKVPPTCFCF